MTSRLGDLIREGQQIVLRYERDLRHPPEKVWRALTESQHLAAWLPCDMEGERRAGSSIILRFWPELAQKYNITDPTMSGQILVWDPPRRFEWTWDVDRLRFELFPTPQGTRLRFTTWLGAAEGGPTPADTASGYHLCLEELRRLLDGEPTHGVVSVDPEPEKARYSQHLAGRRTLVSRVVAAPRARVFAALLDPDQLVRWLAPGSMVCEVHTLEPREGGRFRMSLHYTQEGLGTGKSEPNTDTFGGRYTQIVPNERVEQAVEFERPEASSAEPAPPMRVGWLLEDEGEGTRVIAVCEDIPEGIQLSDNEEGSAMSLAKLAKLTESP